MQAACFALMARKDLESTLNLWVLPGFQRTRVMVRSAQVLAAKVNAPFSLASPRVFALESAANLIGM
jgi:hypothetical protein